MVKNCADIILEIEDHSSRLYKESVILREMSAQNLEFLEGLSLACDRLITFGVASKSVPKVNWEDSTPNELKFSEFSENVGKLIRREVTGNQAKQMISSMAAKCSTHMWNNWYRRILLKDLKCGVDVKTINNCATLSNCPEFEIPVFSCQLAHDSKNHDSKLTGRKILQEKLDGTRVLTIVYPDGRVDQFSRNGKELFNFQHIKDQFSSLANLLNEPMVFDGEIMSESFQALMTQLYRKSDVQTDDSILYLFDYIPLKDFKKGFYKERQIERTLRLSKSSMLETAPNIKILDYITIDMDLEQDKYNEFNKKCIESGKEGIMIKDLDAPYECKRSSAWLKLKPVMTVDLTITDLQEGEDKYEGKLGALVCTGIEDGKEIFVNVGSGLTDEQRELFWNNKYDVIGKIAEIKCDAITQNQNGTYSLRFPRFVRLRGFEINEKI